MTVAIQAYASAWQPQDKRSRCEWATENVRVPNMARGSRFDPHATPWAIEPIDYSADTRVREMIVMWPTGAGKSNFVDVFASHSAAEVEGDILLAVQGNLEAKKYVEKRLVPCLNQIPKVADMFAKMDKFAVKKGSISLPSKTIYWGGANETNAQATSARAVLVDEAWMADHGLLEQFRARLHNRWNRIFVALGQGGTAQIEIDNEMVDTEWQAAWLRTDQREWSFQCPQCGEIQRYRLRGLTYDRGDDLTPLDELAVIQSTRYRCIGTSREQQTCDAIFEDNVNIRRGLSKTGRYVIQHPKHRPAHHGWHLNALGVWYESWADLALQHANAIRALKRGDPESMKIFRQKRMAENHREEDETPQSPLPRGDYTFADYMAGELWPGEAVRIATIDRQRDHFWLCIRAWKVDGTSRRLYFGKVNTEGAILEHLERYKVQPKNVCEDASYEDDAVYNDCARHGWFAVRGDDALFFVHNWRGNPRKYYSQTKNVKGSSGKYCGLIYFASTPLKRILEKMRGGYRPGWEVEENITPEHERHLFSEIEKDVIDKQTKRVRRRFIARHKDNHGWDCEYYQVGMAIIRGMLADAPEQQSKEPEAEQPAE